MKPIVDSRFRKILMDERKKGWVITTGSTSHVTNLNKRINTLSDDENFVENLPNSYYSQGKGFEMVKVNPLIVVSEHMLPTASIRTRVKEYTTFNEFSNIRVWDKYNIADNLKVDLLSEVQIAIIMAYDADCEQRDYKRSMKLISTFVYDALSKNKMSTVEDFFSFFIKLEFSLEAKAALIRITKPFKDRISLRENLIEMFSKELIQDNCSKEEMDNILRSIK